MKWFEEYSPEFRYAEAQQWLRSFPFETRWNADSTFQKDTWCMYCMGNEL